MHKQALAQDGSFNYAFAADNGLQQGESISPDGTRRGAYSYVDPNGKKISVKYTAGKDGFRILEGDHLPKAPAPVAAAPVGGYAPRPPHYQAAPSYTAGYQGAGSNVLFRGQEGSPYYKVQEDYESKSAAKNVYQAAAPATFPAAEQRRAQPIVAQPSTHYGGSAQSDVEGRQEPHNFGGGYAFEFSGWWGPARSRVFTEFRSSLTVFFSIYQEQTWYLYLNVFHTLKFRNIHMA